MAGQTPSGTYAETLDAAVKEIKINKKWKRDYMSPAIQLQEYKEMGKEIGNRRSRNQGFSSKAK